jgi:hypothetical protein
MVQAKPLSENFGCNDKGKILVSPNDLEHWYIEMCTWPIVIEPVASHCDWWFGVFSLVQYRGSNMEAR